MSHFGFGLNLSDKKPDPVRSPSGLLIDRWWCVDCADYLHTELRLRLCVKNGHIVLLCNDE